MKSVFNYLFGDGQGSDGIATVSGDAGGFSYIDKPLDPDEILSTLKIVLEETVLPNGDSMSEEEVAELMEDAVREIQKIHAKHVKLYTSYRT